MSTDIIGFMTMLELLTVKEKLQDSKHSVLAYLSIVNYNCMALLAKANHNTM